MKPIVNPATKFPKRPCALKRCSRLFTPVVEHQRYCKSSHGVVACQERKFKKAVDAAVEERLRELKKFKPAPFDSAQGGESIEPEAGSES